MKIKFTPAVVAIALTAAFGVSVAQTVSEQPTTDQTTTETEVAQGGNGATVYKPGETVPEASTTVGNGNGASVVLPEAARFGQERAAAAKVERVERAQNVERVERVARMERIERPERVERPQRIERPERVERPEQVERPRR